MVFCIAGNTQRLTAITILNSAFTANNATNIESTGPHGIFDVGECAGAHISSCRCAGILNSTFEDNIGIGLCLRDISGTCEPQNESPPEFPPLFDRDTIAGEQNVGMINDFLGEDVSISIAADVRYSTFRNNTAASLLRLNDEPVQPQDPLAGGAGLDILDVPFSVLVGLDFENNNGRQGSGIHLDSCSATVIWNSTLVGNTATHEGGGDCYSQQSWQGRSAWGQQSIWQPSAQWRGLVWGLWSNHTSDKWHSVGEQHCCYQWGSCEL